MSLNSVNRLVKGLVCLLQAETALLILIFASGVLQKLNLCVAMVEIQNRCAV